MPESSITTQTGEVDRPEVQSFIHAETNTISYVVRDPTSKACAIYDSVLDYEQTSGRVSYEHADAIVSYVETNGLDVEWLIETHVHADHLTAAPYIQRITGGRTGIGEKITLVQQTFARIFAVEAVFKPDGSQFDRLFAEDDTYRIGAMRARAIATPGHTPACMVHVVGDAAFVGDTLFMPDAGTARADFPGGSAEDLYDSIQKILSLPDETRLYVCHDYGPGGRPISWQTSVLEQKKANVQVGDGKSRDDFIRLRTDRDRQLAVPRLIIPSLQVNMRAGRFPQDTAGNDYLKTPINKF